MPSDTAHDNLLVEAVKNGNLEETVLDERCMEILELAFRCQENEKQGEYDYEKVNNDIERLVEISKQYDDMATVKKMKDIVPEFKSNNSVYEQLDK